MAFRIAFVAGAGALAALVAAGLYPLAILGAATILPLLVVLYLYDVDLYEDEPLRVVALTMLAGGAAGLVVGYLSRVTSPSGAGALVESTAARALRDGIAWPLAGTALMFAGPLVLLRYRRFNDVLDGTTFGAASAASFQGAALVVGSTGLFGAGLRPTGRTGPWFAAIATGGIAMPLLASTVVGAACGALWLRFRGPVHGRRALGILGRPEVAVALAASAMLAAGISQALLAVWPAFAIVAVLALGGLVWIRHPIHVGLLQEASETIVRSEFTCPNCGARTPRHSFCANCGISLRALPKTAWARPATGAAT